MLSLKKVDQENIVNCIVVRDIVPSKINKLGKDVNRKPFSPNHPPSDERTPRTHNKPTRGYQGNVLCHKLSGPFMISSFLTSFARKGPILVILLSLFSIHYITNSCNLRLDGIQDVKMHFQPTSPVSREVCNKNDMTMRFLHFCVGHGHTNQEPSIHANRKFLPRRFLRKKKLQDF